MLASHNLAVKIRITSLLQCTHSPLSLSPFFRVLCFVVFFVAIQGKKKWICQTLEKKVNLLYCLTNDIVDQLIDFLTFGCIEFLDMLMF